MAAASVSVDVAGWAEEFACGFARIAGRFRRREPRLQARSFLLGVLSDVDTRSCWQLAEQAGDTLAAGDAAAAGRGGLGRRRGP